MEKAALHPSHNLGRSRGSRQYHRKRVFLHSYSPSYVPFIVDGCTASHAPVLVTHRKRHTTWTGAPTMVSVSASSDSLEFRFRTSFLPYLINAECPAVLNSYWPLTAATIRPVTKQDSVHLSGAVSGGYGKSRPACFTVI